MTTDNHPPDEFLFEPGEAQPENRATEPLILDDGGADAERILKNSVVDLDAFRRRREKPAPEGEPEWTKRAARLAAAGWTHKIRSGSRIWTRSDQFGWYAEEIACIIETEEPPL